MKLFGPLYERVLAWSRHPHAERYLGAMSFAESSFFPIPVDVMLAPMCMADRKRSWRFAFIATIFSVLGGVAGYFIGLGPDTFGAASKRAKTRLAPELRKSSMGEKWPRECAGKPLPISL